MFRPVSVLVLVASFACDCSPPPVEQPPAVVKGKITGLVVVSGASGELPAAGAVVELLGSQRKATAGADGKFVLEPVPAGAWRLRASVTRAGVPLAVVSKPVVMPAKPAAVDAGRLVVSVAGRLHGVVRTSTGAPLKGARVVVPGVAQVTTGDDGGYAFVLDQGAWDVAAVWSTGSPEAPELRASGQPAIAVGENTALDFTLGEGPQRAPLRGHASTVDGLVEGTTVTLLEAPANATQTTAEGFEIPDVPAGIYTVVGRRPGHRSSTVTNVVAGAGLDVPPILLEAGTDTLVVSDDCDSDGTPNANEPAICACDAAGVRFVDGACVPAATGATLVPTQQDPAPGVLDVARWHSGVSIVFAETLDASTVGADAITISPAIAGFSASLTSTLGGYRNAIAAGPSGLFTLARNTTYTLTVNPNVRAQASGLRVGTLPPWTFRTADAEVVPAQIVSFAPTGELDVRSAQRLLTVTYDVPLMPPVDPATAVSVGSLAVNAGVNDRSLIIALPATIPDGNYPVSVRGTEIVDLYGQAISLPPAWVSPGVRIVGDGGGTGGDTTAPGLTYSNPGSGATDVAVDVGPFVLSFDEVVLSSSVTTSTVRLETVPAGGSAPTLTCWLDGLQTSIMCSAASSLAEGTRYALVVEGVKDLAGNALTGLRVVFDTVAPVSGELTLTAINPPGAIRNLPLSGVIAAFTLSAPVQASTAASAVTLSPSLAGLVVEVSGSTITLRTGATLLVPATNYVVTIGPSLRGTGGEAPTAPITSAFRTFGNRVGTGARHSCAINAQKQLLCWGDNRYGQAGVASTTPIVRAPTRVGTDSDWVFVTGGGDHTCGIRSEASGTNLYCWGRNDSGQIGDGTNDSTHVPSLAMAGAHLAGLGLEHTCAASRSEMRCWGRGAEGQIGHGSNSDVTDPVSGRVRESGENLVPIELAVGARHSCAVDRSGRLFCWGANDAKQLGLPATDARTSANTPQRVGAKSDWSYVRAGALHTCGSRRVVRGGFTFDPIACWGANSDGQTDSQLTSATRDQPVAYADSFDAATGNLPNNSYVDVVMGSGTTCFHDPYKQFDFYAAGLLHCYGNTEFGIAGAVSGYAQYRVFSGGVPQPPLNQYWLGAGLGEHHACAVANGEAALNRVRCWGDNRWGQLGSDTGVVVTTPAAVAPTVGADVLVSVSPELYWESVQVSRTHTCGFQKTSNPNARRLFCWGERMHGNLNYTAKSDQYPELGHANRPAYMEIPYAASSKDPPVGYAVAEGASSVISDSYSGNPPAPNGFPRRLSWGDNTDGWLAVNTAGAFFPFVYQLGTEGQQSVRFGTVAAGVQHFCAIGSGSDAGKLYCWGRTDEGRAGVTSATPPAFPVQIGSATDWAEVAPGGRHTCARRSDGSVWCWGENADGQLAQGEIGSATPTPVQAGGAYTRIFAGQDATCGNRTDGKLVCWGGNQEGELGVTLAAALSNPVELVGFTSWSAGNRYGCGLKANGELWCAGVNFAGELGLGTTSAREPLTRVGVGPYVQVAVTRASAVPTSALDDRNHTCAVLQTGALQCWGWGGEGQLGLADAARRGFADAPLQVSVVAP